MESMVGKTCSSTPNQSSPGMVVQEKGSRNKRKFRADTPLADHTKVVPEPRNDGTTYEFTAEKFDNVQSHVPSNGCETCGVKSEVLKLDLGLSCAIGPSEVGSSKQEEVESCEAFRDADWNDLTESELQELLLSNLDSNLRTAIKKLVAYGYSEEVAIDAVSKSGQCFGTKDTVSNIVESTLVFLRGARRFETLRQIDFENFQALEHYMLAESVCFLQEVKPNFSTGDAMWYLLVSDMNIPHACVMEAGQQNSMVCDGAPDGSFSTSLPLLSQAESTNPSVGCSHSGLSEATNMASNPYGHTFQSEAPTVLDVSNLKSKVSLVASGLAAGKDCLTSEKTFSLAGAPHLPISEEKFVGSRKVSGIAKREYILRQKSLHLEKNSRTYVSKGGTRTGKISGFGGLMLDKKLKSIADSTGVNTKNTFKIGKAIGVEMPQDNVNRNLSENVGFPSVPAFTMESDNSVSISSKSKLESYNAESSLPTVNTSPALLVADTELSLSLTSKSSSAPMMIKCDAEVPSLRDTAVPIDKSMPHSIPDDKKDDMILKLVPRVQELQNQLQEWTEWANQKVMQAARRLSKDKAELKALRLEKEEVERLKKEKQNLEENTMKKLSEMENALCKASGQVERANAAVRRLEVENAALRKEMEVAKSRAAETAASCEEVSKREKTNMLKFQSREKQKAIYQEELAAEKHKFLQLQQKLKQAEAVRVQLEVMSCHEFRLIPLAFATHVFRFH